MFWIDRMARYGLFHTTVSTIIRSRIKQNTRSIQLFCPVSYETSLNNELFQGPDLTNGLVGVLIRFRQDPVAVMGDVQSMFH